MKSRFVKKIALLRAVICNIQTSDCVVCDGLLVRGLHNIGQTVHTKWSECVPKVELCGIGGG